MASEKSNVAGGGVRVAETVEAEGEGTELSGFGSFVVAEHTGVAAILRKFDLRVVADAYSGETDRRIRRMPITDSGHADRVIR
jgi:hypothetical protein